MILKPSGTIPSWILFDGLKITGVRKRGVPVIRCVMAAAQRSVIIFMGI
jgi:hypothetical protein